MSDNEIEEIAIDIFKQSMETMCNELFRVMKTQALTEEGRRKLADQLVRAVLRWGHAYNKKLLFKTLFEAVEQMHKNSIWFLSPFSEDENPKDVIDAMISKLEKENEQ